MPTSQLPIEGDQDWATPLNQWLNQSSPASLGGIHNGDTASRPSGLVADDEGRIYIDTESQELIKWDGTAWQTLLTGSQEQKFSITAKTADYTITPAEAETGLNGFSNDGASSTVVFTLPDAVAGMKVVVINSKVNQIVEINSQAADTIITADVPDGKNWARAFMIENLKFYAINDTEWVTNENFSISGYFGGGTGRGSVIDGIQFSSETAINPAATLSTERSMIASANSSTKGYFAGGTDGTASNIIDSLKFDNEVVTTPVATLSVARSGVSGVNSTTRGYFTGGWNSSTFYSNEIDGIQFSNETAINPTATLSLARATNAAVNSSTRGYFAGGFVSPDCKDNIDGIIFATETAINPAATLSVEKLGSSATNSDANGYFGGGTVSAGEVDALEKINFSTESVIMLTATLSIARGTLAGANSVTKGYSSGGTSSNYRIDGIEFSGETAINPSATLSVARYGLADCQSGGIL